MTCAACAAHVEKAAGAVDGVNSAAVNLMLGTLVCSYDRDKASPQAIIAAVEAAGYGAAPADDAKRDIRREQDAAAKAMGRRLLWSAVCLVPLFYLSMGHMLGLPVPAFMHRQPLLAAAVQLALCLPILLLNRAYFTVGFSRLFKGSPNMDSLVALGAAAGLTYSLIEMGLLCAGQLAGMPDLYFESAGMILTLVTVGKYLEERSKGKTTGAITALLALAPETAVVRRNGTEVTVAADQIRAGETVIIRQGGRIPVDGTVTKGSGAVDESALTGESMPVEKTPGSSAVSATVLTSGYLELTADRVGADTTLSQIVQLMEQAASSKAPISRLADKISAVFVPVVISIAVLAAVLWATVGGMGIRFCLSIGIAVLVISCPCALGLATPVAITVATGKAAERGILIKSAASLELLGRVDTVVLDKTGTVTAGTPQVTDVLCVPGVTEEELLCAAASLEKPSGHPLADAIVQEAARRSIPLCAVSDFNAVPGGGVQAVLDGKTLYAGNDRYMTLIGAGTAALRAAAEALAAAGKQPESAVYESDALAAGSRMTLTQARNDLQLALLNLSQALNRESAAGFDIVAPALDSMDLAALHRLGSADKVYAYAAENRPHIRAERLRLESSEHAVAVARSALYPSLSLSGGYGTGVYSADKDKFWAQVRHNSREYVGLSLNVPIFNRRAARNDISKAQLAVRSQQLAVTQTVQAKYEFVFRSKILYFYRGKPLQL